MTRCFWKEILALIAISVLAVSCNSSRSGEPAATGDLPAADVNTEVDGTPIGQVPALGPSVTGQGTAGWKEHRDVARGFVFRYPDSCELATLDDSLHVGGRIALTIVDSGGLNLADYVAAFVEPRTSAGDWRIDTTKRDSLAGQDAITVEYRLGGQGRFGTATFVQRGGKIYAWGLTAGGFTCGEPEIYEAVVASFRFTS